MYSARHFARHRVSCLFLAAGVLLGSALHADTVVLKNGLAYRGTIDRDNTIIWIYDGLKRIVIRDSKIARIESDAAFRTLESFPIVQPLVKHGGAMPKEVIKVEAGPWSDRGRRSFSYEGAKAGKPIRMEQAIHELGPYLSRIRGVDGFWQGQVATSQIPRETVVAILGKIDQKDKDARVSVARFLLQAEWYPEARTELDRISKDFPEDADLRARVEAVRNSIVQLEADQQRSSIERARKSQQFAKASSLLKGFPLKDVAPDLLEKIREMERAEAAQRSADESLAKDLKSLVEQVGKRGETDWPKLAEEAIKAVTEAPDAVRDRFVAWRKSVIDGTPSIEAQLALALSGFAIGSDAAVDDLAEAEKIWNLRAFAMQYLRSQDETTRSDNVTQIDAVGLGGRSGEPAEIRLLDALTRAVRLMPPPLHEPASVGGGGKPRLHRVVNNDDEVPTEYWVALPPEYHPLRSYPTVVALHDGQGPSSAIAWWGAEAARRGFIVVAPEYRVTPEARDYTYSVSEHAAVELALRDARRRYAIDSDRVFLGGQLVGGNMAWDYGLAHPDVFAGVAIISGLPFKYVGKYLAHVRSTRLPLYVVLGDLAPAGNELVFNQILKPMIVAALDVTYLEYLKRGLEDFPEEVSGALDWMEQRRREPNPKSFDTFAARESENRIFGVVTREFARGRTTAPEAVDPFGKNLNPATIGMKSSAASNLISLQTNGIKRMDVWLSPKLIDFKRRLEVRINGRSFFKGLAKPDPQAFLEDVRVRGDRQQVYWFRVSAG